MAEHISNIGQELLKMKKELEDLKSKRTEVQGELKGLMKRLKEEFNIKTIEEGETEIKVQEDAINELSSELQEQIDEIKGMMKDEG